MKHLILPAIVAAATAFAAAPAMAKQNCPPGLAKKAVPCVPPGLAKKGVRYDDDDHRYDDRAHHDDRDYRDRLRVGDLYVDSDGRIRVRDYDRYRLPRLGENETYYRDGRIVYRVNDETRRVIELIRLADLVFGN